MEKSLTRLNLPNLKISLVLYYLSLHRSRSVKASYIYDLPSSLLWQKCGIEVHEAELKAKKVFPQISLPMENTEEKVEHVSEALKALMTSY